MTTKELEHAVRDLFNDHDPSQPPRLLRGAEVGNVVDLAKRFAIEELEKLKLDYESVLMVQMPIWYTDNTEKVLNVTVQSTHNTYQGQPVLDGAMKWNYGIDQAIAQLKGEE